MAKQAIEFKINPDYEGQVVYTKLGKRCFGKSKDNTVKEITQDEIKKLYDSEPSLRKFFVAPDGYQVPN